MLTIALNQDEAFNPAWMGGVLDGSGDDRLALLTLTLTPIYNPNPNPNSDAVPAPRLRLSPKRHLDEHHLGSMSGIDTVAAFQALPHPRPGERCRRCRRLSGSIIIGRAGFQGQGLLTGHSSSSAPSE